jgi:CxxC-x17-CxxC domain-containing protein
VFASQLFATAWLSIPRKGDRFRRFLTPDHWVLSTWQDRGILTAIKGEHRVVAAQARMTELENTSGDRTLNCRECAHAFVWSAGEQAYYASKNLMNPPSRCPACRERARNAGGSRVPGKARARELFPVVCTRCGIQTQVPFMPRDDRPVYCSACFDLVRLPEERVPPSG